MWVLVGIIWVLVGIILVVAVAGCVLAALLGQARSDLRSALQDLDHWVDRCVEERVRADVTTPGPELGDAEE